MNILYAKNFFLKMEISNTKNSIELKTKIIVFSTFCELFKILCSQKVEVSEIDFYIYLIFIIYFV